MFIKVLSLLVLAKNVEVKEEDELLVVIESIYKTLVELEE